MYYYVEPMTDDDIEHVQAVERQSFSTLWSANTYRNELRNTNTSRYIVARASPTPPPPQFPPAPRRGFFERLIDRWFGERPVSPPATPQLVGYGGLWLSVDEGHITTIAVGMSYRGKGLGELLLNGLIDQAMALGAQHLTLEVRVTNEVAQRLYIKYGFKAVGKRPRYYTDNNEDALIMSTDPIREIAYQERLSLLRDRLYTRLRAEATPEPKQAPVSR